MVLSYGEAPWGSVDNSHVLCVEIQAPQRMSVISEYSPRSSHDIVWSIKETIFSPLLSSVTFVINHDYIYGSISRICPAPLICLPVFIPKSCCINYYIYIVGLDTWSCKSSFFFLSWIVLAFVGPLHFHITFRVNLSISTKKIC